MLEGFGGEWGGPEEQHERRDVVGGGTTRCKAYDSNVPYYVSINLVSWVLSAIWQIPLVSKKSSTIVFVSPNLTDGECVMSAYLAADTTHTLTPLSMVLDMWGARQFQLMAMCVQTAAKAQLCVGNPVMRSMLGVRKVAAGTLYHMYDTGGGGSSSFGNLDHKSSARILTWAAAAHTAKAITRIVSMRPCGKKKNCADRARGPYKDMDKQQNEDEDDTSSKATKPESWLQQSMNTPQGGKKNHGGGGWRTSCKIASIGHITVGWAARMIRMGNEMYA